MVAVWGLPLWDGRWPPGHYTVMTWDEGDAIGIACRAGGHWGPIGVGSYLIQVGNILMEWKGWHSGGHTTTVVHSTQLVVVVVVDD